MTMREENRKKLDELGFEENKAYIVLGMHRAGTSFISKALHDQGVDMRVEEKGSSPSKFNPLGQFESGAFRALTDKIIMDAGGGWDNPPSEQKIEEAAGKYKEEIKKTIKDNEDKFWGWKDPRTALTADLFLPHIEGDVYLVCVFRKPKKVEDSLRRRGHASTNIPHLSKEYNRRIIETIKKFLDV